MGDNVKRRACDGKHGHKSEGAANAQLRSMVESLGYDVRELHAYHCVYCRDWHVGRVDKKKLEYRKRH